MFTTEVRSTQRKPFFVKNIKPFYHRGTEAQRKPFFVKNIKPFYHRGTEAQRKAFFVKNIKPFSPQRHGGTEKTNFC
jgi:hypothetical protein